MIYLKYLSLKLQIKWFIINALIQKREVIYKNQLFSDRTVLQISKADMLLF